MMLELSLCFQSVSVLGLFFGLFPGTSKIATLSKISSFMRLLNLFWRSLSMRWYMPFGSSRPADARAIGTTAPSFAGSTGRVAETSTATPLQTCCAWSRPRGEDAWQSVHVCIPPGLLVISSLCSLDAALGAAGARPVQTLLPLFFF